MTRAPSLDFDCDGVYIEDAVDIPIEVVAIEFDLDVIEAAVFYPFRLDAPADRRE